MNVINCLLYAALAEGRHGIDGRLTDNGPKCQLVVRRRHSARNEQEPR